MSGGNQSQQAAAAAAAAARQALAAPAYKLVVATTRGYYGNQIRDPNGSEKEQAPFRVPADAKAKWFVDYTPPAKAKAAADDIG